MPVFKTSFLKPGFSLPASGSGGFSMTMANSELSMLADRLVKDGFLNQADYDILIEKAKELKTRFNWNTSKGRNAVASLDSVISSYGVAKDTLLRQRSDITETDKIFEDDLKTIKFIAGVNPDEYFNKTITRYKEYIDSVGQLYLSSQESGNFKQANDSRAKQDELQFGFDNISTMKASYDKSKQSKEKNQNVGVFIATDSDGNITDVSYRQLVGDFGGYMPTNASLNNLKVYLRPTKGFNGVNYGTLANKQFSDEKNIFDMTTGVEIKQLTSGAEDIELKQENLRIRNHIPKNGWVKGRGDIMYQNVGDNKYFQYLKTTPEELKIKDTDYMEVNDVWESRIKENVVGQGGLPGALRAVDTEYDSPFNSSLFNLQRTEPSVGIEPEAVEAPAMQPITAQTTPALKTKQVSKGIKGLWERGKSIFRGNTPTEAEEIRAGGESWLNLLE